MSYALNSGVRLLTRLYGIFKLRTSAKIIIIHQYLDHDLKLMHGKFSPIPMLAARVVVLSNAKPDARRQTKRGSRIPDSHMKTICGAYFSRFVMNPRKPRT